MRLRALPLLLARAGVPLQRHASFIQLTTGPEEAASKQLMISRLPDSLHIVAQCGSKDASLAVLVGPADSMHVPGSRALSFEQHVGPLFYRDRLVQFVPRGLPVVRKTSHYGMIRVDLFGSEGLVGVVDACG